MAAHPSRFKTTFRSTNRRPTRSTWKDSCKQIWILVAAGKERPHQKSVCNWHCTSVSLELFAYFIGKHPELKAEKELWFDDFHYNIGHMARADSIKSFRPLKKKTKGIRRKMCINMLKNIMLRNEAKSWEKRAVIALLRKSVGRGGEVSTITWDSVY